MSRARLWCGDVRAVLATLPERGVQTVVTSPPYWGLRDYGTAAWEGGDTGCDHLTPPSGTRGVGRDRAASGGKFHDSPIPKQVAQSFRDVCGKCGARRVDNQLGLERTPEEYVANMVAVFREVRRVLRDDGTLWLNLGDSYATPKVGNTNGSGGSTLGEWKNGGRRKPDDVKNGTKPLPPGCKPKDLVGIPWAVAFALRSDGWYLRSEIVWCLSGGTRVYARTQKGEMPMTIKDMVRLDPSTVQLWNGEKWTQVLGWNQSPDPRAALEIELRSGERIGCTPGHQWPTQRGLLRADELQPGDVIQTARLPEPPEPESPKAIPDEFGYLVGLYLAEGSTDSRGVLQFAGHAREVEQRMDALGYLTHDYGAHVTAHVYGNKSTVNVRSAVVAAMLREYVHGDDSRTKGLKVAAWRRSNQFLHHLLLGYLTGDAHLEAVTNRYRLGFTRNDRLAADLRTLCARLGLPLRLAPCHVEGFGKRWPAYRGDVRLTPSEHWNAREAGEVVAIRSGKGRQFWDIGVADEPHLFALGSGVLTHNSKPNPMPESVTDRPTKAHEQIFLLSKSASYYYDAAAIAEPVMDSSVARVSQNNGNPNWNGDRGRNYPGSPQTLDINRMVRADGTRNTRSVWTIATQPYAGAHFATFPEELARRCILAGSAAKACESCGAAWERVVEREKGDYYVAGKTAEKHKQGLRTALSGYGPGGPPKVIGESWQPTCTCPINTGGASSVVLDPFGGSGTVAAVATGHGREAWHIDLNPAYIELARERIGPMLCVDAA